MTASSYYLAYARRGREIDVRDRLSAAGLDAWAPEVVEYCRRGDDRRPRRYDSLLIPGLLVVEGDLPEIIIRDYVPGLAPTFTRVPRPAVTRKGDGLLDFMSRVDGEREVMLSRIESGEAVANYKTGQRLMISGGALQDMVVTFLRLVRAGTPSAAAEVEASILGAERVLQVEPTLLRKEA